MKILNTHKKRVVATVGVIAALIGGLSLRNYTFAPPPPPSISPPGTINDTCSTDVTSSLKTWLSTVPNNSYINFPSSGCYLVSGTGSSYAGTGMGIALNNVSNVTLNGNGTTIEQSSYATGGGASNVQPIMQMVNDSNVEVENLTLQGPRTPGPLDPNDACGGCNEGDYGVMFCGSTGVLFTNNTIQYLWGDFIALYSPQGCFPYYQTQAIGPNLNFGITVSNSTFLDSGYHGVTPEGVVGFTFSNNTMTNVPEDAFDLEVDAPGQTVWTGSCPSPQPIYSSACIPTDFAEINITIIRNTFTSIAQAGIWFQNAQAALATQGYPYNILYVAVFNTKIIDNTMNTGSGLDVGNHCFDMHIVGNPAASFNTNVGLTVQGNICTGLFQAGVPNFFVPHSGPGMFQLYDVQNVNIQSNTVQGVYDGAGPPTNIAQTGGGPPVLAICTCNDDTNVLVKNNFMSGAINQLDVQWGPGTYTGAPGPGFTNVASPGAANTNVTICNNIFGFNTPNSGAIPSVTSSQGAWTGTEPGSSPGTYGNSLTQVVNSAAC